MVERIARDEDEQYNVYDFKNGITRNFYLEIMTALQTARLQAFVTASRIGFVIKFYHFNNLKLTRATVNSVHPKKVKFYENDNADTSRAICQELIRRRSTDLFQQIWEDCDDFTDSRFTMSNACSYLSFSADLQHYNIYAVDVNNCIRYMDRVRVTYSESTKLRSEFSQCLNRSCPCLINAQKPRKPEKLPGTNMKGIYGQGFYNNIQPEPYDDDDDVQHGNEMFLLFSMHHRVLEAARSHLEAVYSTDVSVSYEDILTRFGDPQYVKVVMQNSLRLRFFTVNICFKIFYYVRHIFPELELNQRFQVMHCLNVTNNIFDKIQILGYSLLLYDNNYVDYYTFKVFQQFSDEFEKISDDHYKLTPQMRDAMAMEFLDSDFIEIVVKACDVTADVSCRKRMRYTQKFDCV